MSSSASTLSVSPAAAAAEAELLDIIGRLQTFRRTTDDAANVEWTPGLLVQIAYIDRIIAAAEPLLAEPPYEADSRPIVMMRGVRALRRLLS